jgi:valyl-tRNA synthetase
MNLPTDRAAGASASTLADRWILSRLSAAVGAVDAGLSTYNMDDAARAAYHFFWDDFCDWYIEAAKPTLDTDATRARALSVLEEALKLLHPLLPHLTETIWQALPGERGFLMNAAYPAAGTRDEAAEAQFGMVQEIVTAIRTLQATHSLKKGGEAFVTPTEDSMSVLQENAPLIEFLTRSTLVLRAGPDDGFLQPTRFGDVRLPRPEASPEEVATEKRRIESELVKLEKDLTGLDTRLTDPSFAQRAPEAVVSKARTQHAELTEKKQKLTERLTQLG